MKTRMQSEKGSIVLVVLMVLVLVSLYGISSLNSSSTELMISRNGRVYKQNIYRAEAAVREIGQILELDSNPVANLKPVSSSYDWLSDGTVDTPSFKPETSDWEYSGSDPNAVLSPLFTDNASGYTVVFEGVAAGGSLNMTGSQMWQYSIYGLSQLGGGRVGVVSGYRRRF